MGKEENTSMTTFIKTVPEFGKYMLHGAKTVWPFIVGSCCSVALMYSITEAMPVEKRETSARWRAIHGNRAGLSYYPHHTEPAFKKVIANNKKKLNLKKAQRRRKPPSNLPIN